MTNKEKYLELCKTQPSICVYDQPWWMDAVCGEENWDVLLYENGTEILGALPYYMKQKYGLRYITQPPMTQHNGPWIKYPTQQSESKRISWEKKVIDTLINTLESLGVCHYQQNCSPSLTNWLPFYWRGYRQTTNYTYRLNDIRNPDLLLKDFQSNKRKNINKARNANVSIKFDLPAEEFYLFHKGLLKKCNKEIGYTCELFQRIYDAAYTQNSGRTIYAIGSDGTLLCTLFNIWDKNYGYNLITAIDPETRSSGAPDLLVFNMLKYLSDKVNGYDFEGSMIEGVEESYRHFGSAQTPYFSVYKTFTRNPVIKYAISQKLR